MSFILRSSAFSAGSPIPRKYTCQGLNVSPPLSWSGAPEGTKSFVLIVEDPDAPNPNAPQRTWVHWVLYDIPAHTTTAREGEIPEGARCGENDWKRADYGGPCPPVGRHRYFHRLYAVDRFLANARRPTKADLLHAMEGHILGEATLIGTYEKAGWRVVRY
jgi:Raf kinase inhibitor-like YbhB/YbcL family protein